MDEKERAAWEWRMRNEDEIIHVLEGDDSAEQAALAQLHGWTREQTDRFRHYAHLRKDALGSAFRDFQRRQQITGLDRPEMTQEERDLSVYWEDIEPQVRQAVRQLIDKGYWPVYSGFRSVGGDQTVWIDNVDMGEIALPDRTRDALSAKGFATELHGGKIILRPAGLATLDQLTAAWNILADGLPDHPPRKAWRRPSWKSESGEIDRTSSHLGLDPHAMTRGFQEGRLEELSEDEWNALENADSRDPSWTLDDVIEYRTTDDRPERRDVMRIVDGMRRGDTLPAPIVLHRDGHPPYLVAGNTRLLVARALGKRPYVFSIRI